MLHWFDYIKVLLYFFRRFTRILYICIRKKNKKKKIYIANKTKRMMQREEEIEWYR